MEKNYKTELKNYKTELKKYLIALPYAKGCKGFNHPTILISASNEDNARSIAMYMRPKSYIGDIKEVHY